MVALDAVHLADGGSEQAAKRTCKLCGYKEESESLLSFCSFVPHADQVETWSEVRVSRRIETSAVAFHYSHPGKTPDSVSPRKKRVVIKPPYPRTSPCRVITRPKKNIHNGTI